MSSFYGFTDWLSGWLPPAAFGWPAVGLALALVAGGIVRRKPWWVAAGAVAATPFSLYLAGTPLLRGWALLPVPALALAAWAVARGRSRLAWGLVVPFGVLVGWVGWAVLQPPIVQDEMRPTPDQTIVAPSAPYPLP